MAETHPRLPNIVNTEPAFNNEDYTTKINAFSHPKMDTLTPMKLGWIVTVRTLHPITGVARIITGIYKGWEMVFAGYGNFATLRIFIDGREPLEIVVYEEILVEALKYGDKEITLRHQARRVQGGFPDIMEGYASYYEYFDITRNINLGN